MIRDAIAISLKMSIISTIFSSIIGTILAYSIYKKKTAIISLLDTLILLPIFLPPSLIGYILLISLGRNGVIGRFIYNNFNISIIFTWQAGVIATFIMSLPIIYQNSKAAFLNMNNECEEAAILDGATRFQNFIHIVLPMTIRGILCGVILGFARAFSEFGATLMVAGNIPGKTQNLPMAIYYAVEAGDRATANKLLLIIFLIGIILVLLFNHLIKRSYFEK